MSRILKHLSLLELNSYRQIPTKLNQKSSRHPPRRCLGRRLSSYHRRCAGNLATKNTDAHHFERRIQGGPGDSQRNNGLKHQPLSLLPLRMILRSLATSSISSSPKLLDLSLYDLRILARSDGRLLHPDRNVFLRYILDASIYKQFCAGQDANEIAKTVAQVKHIGFTGTILAYAKETPTHPTKTGNSIETDLNSDPEVEQWLMSSLETVQLAAAGDFVAFKFTGAGFAAHERLVAGHDPSDYMAESFDRICQLAKDRRVRVLIDGEHDAIQDTIDKWTMMFARKHNTTPGRALVFGTYQAYKKAMPQVLASHLQEARRGNLTLGVKLVRGAYLHSDPARRLQDSKADTDACYDSTAASVLKREWNSTLQGSGAYPQASVMLATHNATSVRKAYAIHGAGHARSEILFAQLQGMADEISCELVQMNAQHYYNGSPPTAATAFLPVYKYMAWGTTGECMKYLLRRAEENRDAVTRTRVDRDAMWWELVRRARTVFHTK